MKFSADPFLIDRARTLILHDPDLNVLRPRDEGAFAALAQRLEADLKFRNTQGKLLLPDLSALGNRTIGIFSDYAGEGLT